MVAGEEQLVAILHDVVELQQVCAGSRLHHLGFVFVRNADDVQCAAPGLCLGMRLFVRMPSDVDLLRFVVQVNRGGGPYFVFGLQYLVINRGHILQPLALQCAGIRRGYGIDAPLLRSAVQHRHRDHVAVRLRSVSVTCAIIQRIVCAGCQHQGCAPQGE